ncbi:hypothetical protein BIW11_13308 [Tropilaelaps mercedesae]|uniref:Uncharacterized protein n=1 Tax=Tropilaelaps mercedesae TaxID=418985 RepID=A0A1V9X2R8_9ACAR|nr:hypothetical protein BIW11_13308 [Tropilaelaps mercedesae]
MSGVCDQFRPGSRRQGRYSAGSTADPARSGLRRRAGTSRPGSFKFAGGTSVYPGHALFLEALLPAIGSFHCY